jgi:hypothetical protein
MCLDGIPRATKPAQYTDIYVIDSKETNSSGFKSMVVVGSCEGTEEIISDDADVIHWSMDTTMTMTMTMRTEMLHNYTHYYNVSFECEPSFSDVFIKIKK